MCVLPMGRPIGVMSPTRSSLIVAQTVLSVGPYALIRRLSADQRLTRSAEMLSPATMRLANGKSLLVSRLLKLAGGKVACVTCWRIIALRSASPLRSSAFITTNVAPLQSVTKISDTDASKLKLANDSTLELAASRNRSLWAATSDEIPLAVLSTPLGAPVDRKSTRLNSSH